MRSCRASLVFGASMGRKLLRSLASLRLTVTLLALSMVLIFLGTLAQARLGIWETVDTYFRSLIARIDPAIFFPQGEHSSRLRIPFPGGFTLGALLLVNLLAAHAARFRFSARRLGVLVLHAGLIVLLIGEFVTARYADEGMMRISVGESSQFVEDLRSVELAVSTTLNPASTSEVIVPGSDMLHAFRSGRPLPIGSLPLHIIVEQWLPNARLVSANERTHADRGVGVHALAEELPPARGVDGAQTDSPAAYVSIIQNGRTLGRWLLWTNLIDPQQVTLHDGSIIHIALRYRRTYRPYAIHLLEFRHDVFTGTTIPRNFSSRVRIVDPQAGVEREATIWMNNPLRYRGDTFYQASYAPDGTGTVLQVVRNPGAFLPYLACSLVAVGMTAHFTLGLTAFFGRRASRNARPRLVGSSSPRDSRSIFPRLTPWIAACLGILLATAGLWRPAPAGDYDLHTFGKLPVSAGGRVKPMDTAARHALLVAGGRQSIRTDSEKIDARAFLIGLIARPDQVRDFPVVRIDHPDLLAIFGLRPEEVSRVSLAAVEPHWENIAEQALRALDVPAGKRDPYQRAVVRLYNGVQSLLLIAHLRQPYIIPPDEIHDQWRPFTQAFLGSPLALPPGHPDIAPEPQSVHPAVAYYAAMLTAYHNDNPRAFNQAVQEYEALLRAEMPATMRRVQLETLFNRASLFTGTMAVYLLVFLLSCGSMLLRLGAESGRFAPAGERLRVLASAFLWAALIVHTAAILLRMELQGRPPVTNLYSSAVFVGWAAVLFGAVIERLYPLGVAAIGASVVGFSTLVVAHHLGSDGDTMQMMQAVLDSNFWLATHVTTITLGYSATFFAGAIAAIYILLGVCTKRLNPDLARMLGRMVYGVVCFALLLSFVGTVLGGIWADQSWGRFWGWDPKENGAALVVLLNAIILHARWAGIVRLRGIMMLAVAGNIVTAWSWFGTNMLGVGLHAYGFMDSALFWLVLFVISQLALIALAMLPVRIWRSRPLSAQIDRPNPSRRQNVELS
ncbi:MAG: cytochrome c biogenesis protein CcsA [Phycisphaeraceae bacterium]|nr:cytochrome c biogenesis protein CcsA [Phycisphaeraceae bacterium]